MAQAFAAFAKNPALGEPPAIKEPGEFGTPYDESESHLYFGPLHKGVAEAQQDWGVQRLPSGPTDVASDIWDSITEGVKNQYKALREGAFKSSPGTREENQGPMVLGAALATPIAFVQSGIVGLLKMTNGLPAQYVDAIQHPEPDAQGITGRQRLGRAIGHTINVLMQFAMLEKGGEFGEAAPTGKVGEMMDKAAANPGNALVRANRESNYMFGKNPGEVLREKTIHPTFTLEKLRQQVEDTGNLLHRQVNVALKSADTVQAIMPNGTVQRVPNLLDWATEIENAADEVKGQVKKQGGMANRAAVVKAINDMRDDILNDHDLEGNATGPKSRTAPPSQVNEIKKSIGGRGNYKVFTDANEAEKAAVVDRFIKKAYGRLNDLADNAVGGAPGESVRDLNRRYSNVIEFRNLIDKRIALENGTGGWNAAARKTGWGAAAYSLYSGHPVVGGGLLANQVLRTTAGRIVTAKTLDAAARALQSPAARVAAGAAGTAAGAVPAASGAARRVLAGEEAQ